MADGERKRTLEVARRAPPAGELSGRAVLIVDDDPVHLRHVRDGLTPHGYVFTEAHDGTQALSAIRESRPDLILMDVEMPGLGDDELIDPTISAETLLYRLFHEDGVRVFESQPLKAFCRCSQERIETVLRSFGPEERADMFEPDGKIRVTCEYCSRVYSVAPETLETP